MNGPKVEPGTAIYGFTSKTRCIAAMAPAMGPGMSGGSGRGDEDDDTGMEEGHSRFMVGTLSLREENELHVVSVDDDNPSAPMVQEEAVYQHPGEVWVLSPCPRSDALVFTSYNAMSGDGSGSGFGSGALSPMCTLWKLPGSDSGSEELESVAEAKCSDGPIKSVLWNPRGGASVVLLDAHSIRQATVDGGELRETAAITRPDTKFTGAKWSAMQEHIVGTTNNTAVKLWDLRTGQIAASIDRSHSDNVRALDFNPHSSYYFATGGDDCKVRIWDSRRTAKPVRSLAGHSHWVWNVCYNKFHDELLVSSGSDGKVILWNCTSVASRFTNAPTGGAAAADPAKEKEKETAAAGGDDMMAMAGTPKSMSGDGVIKVFEEHEDSVYGLAWGSSPGSSLWNFASLSYAGRMVVNYVPLAHADIAKYC